MRIHHALLVGLTCLTAAACSPKPGEYGDQFFPHGKWEQIPLVPQNIVEVITLDHRVSFSHGQAELTQAARGALSDFILGNRVGPDDRIAVRGPRDADGELAAERLTSVKSEFARLGLVAFESDGRRGWPGGAGPGNGEVSVLVTRAVVIPPDCSVPRPDPTLRPNHLRGCADTAALGMMVANPTDLLGARELGPADGEQASAALRRYREGQVKELMLQEGIQ